MKKQTEFQKFDKLVQRLLKMPHSEIKEKLEKEKRSKRQRKSKHDRKDCTTLQLRNISAITLPKRSCN